LAERISRGGSGSRNNTARNVARNELVKPSNKSISRQLIGWVVEVLPRVPKSSTRCLQPCEWGDGTFGGLLKLFEDRESFWGKFFKNTVPLK
jgi:hypothetical protein